MVVSRAGEVLEGAGRRRCVRLVGVGEFLLQNGFSSVVSVMGGIDAYAIDADGEVPRYQNEMKGEECSSCG